MRSALFLYPPSCRPHHETLKAYVRKLSALALEVVQSGGVLEGGAGAKAQGEVRQQHRLSSRPAMRVWLLRNPAQCCCSRVRALQIWMHGAPWCLRAGSECLRMGRPAGQLPAAPSGRALYAYLHAAQQSAT